MSNSTSFTDFNFKICVIDYLMYRRGVLTPRFDLLAFAQGMNSSITDISEIDEPVLEAAKNYFEQLELPAALLETITELNQSPSDGLMEHVDAVMGYQEDFINIQSAEDCRLLPNLKRIGLHYSTGELKDAFESRGIAVVKAMGMAMEATEASPATPAAPAQQPSGNATVFHDFNFKLAVVQVLMYEQQLLTTKFDVHSFAKTYTSRKIDTEAEGYGIIPEVAAYFRQLHIPAQLLAQVTEIYQDGGNEIHHQLYPFWDGEDETFNIRSAEDCALVPNLKKVTLLYDDSNRILDEFRKHGVEAGYI